MPITEVVRLAVAAVAGCVVAWAAVSDIRTRRIPNWTVLALIALFVPFTIADGGAYLVSALEAAGIALAVSVGLYMFKMVGAGDSKLFTACALYAGMGYLPSFALATVLTGGIIALLSLASRPQRLLAMITLRGKGDWGPGIPYGVAIALGAVIVNWAALTGVLAPFGYGHTAPLTTEQLSRGLHQIGGH